MSSNFQRLVLSLAMLTAACDTSSNEPAAGEETDGAEDGSSGDGEPASTDGAAGDGTTGDGSGADESPVYAVVTQVFAPMGQTSYVVLTDDITTAGTLTLEAGIELAGRAVGAGPAGEGALFVGGSEDGTVTRYDLADDGKSLRQGQTVSFAGLGIDAIGEYQEQFQFVSDEKAYYLDGRTAQLVVWNPREMVIEQAVPLDELVLDGQLLTFSTNVFRHQGKLLAPVAWRSDSTASIPSQTAVVLVDVSDDRVTVLSDARCGYVRTAVAGADGRFYLATEAYGSAVHRIAPEHAPAPCLLRLNAELTAFDASFHVALSSLVGGATAGTLLPGPTPERAWLRVLDESVAGVGPQTHPRVLASAPVWAWWSIALTDTPEAREERLGLSNGSDFLLNTDDAAMIPEFSADRSTTVLRDMREGVPGDSTLSIPGLTFSVVRLR